MTRKTLTLTEAAYERLEEHKRENESWTDLGHRAADALDGQGDGEHEPNTVVVSNVDEVAEVTATKVENRLPSR